MSKLEDILSQELNKAVRALQDNLEKYKRNATKDTSNSIRSKVTQSGNRIEGKITANKSLRIIESGRGPTKSGTKGSDVLFKALKRWIEHKAEVPNEALYAIFKNINKYGWNPQNPNHKPLPYRNAKGGTPWIITSVINDQWIAQVKSKLKSEISKEYTVTISQDITKINASSNNG